jgi:general secretion pathway protein H
LKERTKELLSPGPDVVEAPRVPVIKVFLLLFLQKKKNPFAVPARTAGFTLIEMMVVLVVLGLALTLILARGPMRSVAAEAGSAAGSVAQALRVARAQAIAQGRPLRVLLDAAGHRVLPENLPAVALPAAVSMDVTDASGARMRAGVIGFAPDGSSTGGAVELADGGRRVRVAVDWLTGRVRVDAGQ